MYIFKYYNKGTGQFIGYHTSTFCQNSKVESTAKRYSCETEEQIEKQKEIILDNLKSTLNTTEEDTKKEGLSGLFKGIAYEVKNKYYPNLSFDDIELISEKVEDVEIKHKITNIINNGLSTKVDMSLEEGIKALVKDRNGAHPREENNL